MDNKLVVDVVIVGAGPVGLFAAFQAGMLGMRAIVIDALSVVGGQCAVLYPEKPIFDIPAYERILASDLIANLKKQADKFDTQYLLNREVISFSKNDDVFVLQTSASDVIECRAIFIAAGSGIFGPNRPPIDSIESYEGKSVFYYVDNISRFKNMHLAIVGGGDSAVDWAIELSTVASKIYFVHRRAKFRAMQSSVDQLMQIVDSGIIELIIPYQLYGINGHDGYINEVELIDLDGKKKLLVVDALLAFFGLYSNMKQINDWGFEMSRNQIIVSATSCMTSIQDVYAIGDVALYDNKIKLISIGFAEAAKAMHHAYAKVFNGKELHFEHSTTKFISSKLS